MDTVRVRQIRAYLDANPGTFGALSDAAVLAALTLRDIAVTKSIIMTPVDMLREAADIDVATIASAIDKMDTKRGGASPVALVKWGLSALETRGIDLGNARVRATIDSMIGAGGNDLTAAEAAALKGLADTLESIADQQNWPELYEPNAEALIVRARAGE